MVTLEQVNIMKAYVRNQMEEDRWLPVNDKQRDVFKHLIMEWYGWPVFTLNFNNDLTKIMKCKL